MMDVARNMINICTKYGFDGLIISGSYGGHRRHTKDDSRRTTDDGRRTTPGVWHKLPTGELKRQWFGTVGWFIQLLGGRFHQESDYPTHLAVLDYKPC